MRNFELMRHSHLFSLALAASAWFAGSCFAQVGLKIGLVSEVTSIKPGQPFHVGLFIQHEKGWHTYWKQPGVVGVQIAIHGVAVHGRIVVLPRVDAFGPQGLGGETTVLRVHVEWYPTHIASLPVAVNINCHAARHAEVVL